MSPPRSIRSRLKITDQAARLPPIVILKLRRMTAIDATGLRAIDQVAACLQTTGRMLIVCGAPPQPAAPMAAANFAAHVGAANPCPDTTEACTARANSIAPAATLRDDSALTSAECGTEVVT